MKADGESVESMAMPRLGGLAAWVALTLALVAALAAISVAEDAEAFTVDGIDYEVTDEGSHQVKITSYSGSPKYVYGTVSFGGADWTVVSVGGYAFEGCGSLATADLPSAASVGDYAFHGCVSLTVADLPSAAYVGESAFHVCDALKHVRFSDELESVGSYAFTVSFYSGSEWLSADAASLKGRTFVGGGNGVLHEGFAVASPDGGELLCRATDAASNEVEVVGFLGRPAMVSGSVSYGGADWTVVSVGDYAFHGCKSLTAADLPSAASVGSNAFHGCKSLTAADLPSAASVGSNAFLDCGSLTTVDLPSAIYVGEWAFYGCGALTFARFSDALEWVGNMAFTVSFYSGSERLSADADSLKGKSFIGDGDGRLHEGFWAPSQDGGGDILYKMTSFFVREVEVVGFSGAPVRVSGMVTYKGSDWAVVSLHDHAFFACDSLEIVDITEVREIGGSAFSGCPSLREVIIPSSMQSIGDGAFEGLVFKGPNGEELPQDAVSLRGHLYLGDGDGTLGRSERDGTCGDGLYWSLDADGVLTIAGEGYMEDYGGDRGPWGYGVTRVVAGDGVRSIGVSAFNGCRSLVSASMPAATSIGNSAFNYCDSLVSLEMPAAASIGIGAFSRCESLESASMPAAVSIGDGAFEVCDSLREVLIPLSVESIGEGAFGDLTFLGPDGEELDRDAEALRGHLYLGEDGRLEIADGEGTCGDGLRWEVGLDGVLRISGEGYMDDFLDTRHGPWSVWVKGVVAGDGVKSVGAFAFRECKFLVSASLPGVQSVGERAFSGCGYYLESVSMPSAAAIGDRAFYGCISLESVCLPRTLASLGDRAFYGLTFLDEGGRTLSQDAESLRGYVYEGSGDGKLKRLPFAQDGVGYQVCGEGLAVAVGWYGEPSALRIPDEVQYNGKGYALAAIADGAFAGCGTLETITIGSAVASIGEGALDAPMLRSIEVSSGNAEYSSIAGVLYDKDASVLLKFPASKQRLVIPDTVEEIAPFAFENAGAALKAEQGGGDVSYLRYVSVPGSVVSIGEGAFRGSTLEVLKLADGIKAIGAEAFSGCSSLSYVVFCDTLEEAGEDAFDGCAFFGEDGEPMEFGIGAVSGHKFTLTDAPSLSMYVPAPGGTISSGGIAYKITGSGEDKAVYACRLADASLTEIDVPATIRYLGFDWTVTSVGAKAFYGNGSITGATVAVDVGSKSFANCRGLESVTLAGAGKVGLYAFFGCTSLASADIGSVSALGESAFSGCRSLADVDLSKVATVGKHAFYGCALTRADLSSAETIGYGAFTGNDLREVVFSSGLESVDPKAFFRYSFCGADGEKLHVAAADLAGLAFVGSSGKLHL
jgi:hypothetical protein